MARHSGWCYSVDQEMSTVKVIYNESLGTLTFKAENNTDRQRLKLTQGYQFVKPSLSDH